MNNNNNHNQIATIQSGNCRHPIAVPVPIPIPTVTCDFASDASTCSDVAIDYNQGEYALKHTLKVTIKIIIIIILFEKYDLSRLHGQ